MAASQRSLMMEIEIKFGKGRSDRVKVHYDDDADILAEEFVRRHKLKETSKPVIAQYISSTMENFLNQPRRTVKEKRGEINEVPKAVDGTPLGVQGQSDAARYSPHSSRHELYPSENARPPPLPGSSKLSRPSSFMTTNSIPDATESLNDKVDETDLMSQISRSLSMSMDYKQYQENVDRRMNMRTFSFKDIAAETAVLARDLHSSSSERAPSVDSDQSTIAATKPQSPSVHETLVSERTGQDADTTWNSFSGIGYGGLGDERRRTSGRYAPLSQETMEDHSRGHYSSSLEHWHDLSPKSRAHQQSRDTTTSHFFRDSHSPSDLREEVMTVSEVDEDVNSQASEGPSPEEMYNRAKMNSMQNQNHQNVATAQTHFGDSYGGGGASSVAKVLKPSSSTMQLGLHRSSLSSNQTAAVVRNDKSLVGKSANERLYNAAQLDRDKRSRRAKIANDIEIKELGEGKFKLNSASKKIVANLRPKGYANVHIGERLYEEGVVEKQLKVKRSDDLQGKLIPEEWSCAKCGTFQMLAKTSIVIQPLHQLQNKAHIKPNANGGSPTAKAAKPVMVCKKCGWDQGAVQAHRPVNIALMLNEDSGDLLKSRWQGSAPVSEEGGIHQYLYENARTRENIQQLNRVLWNEAHSGLSFTPSLPEASQEILEKYKTTTAPGTNNGAGTAGHSAQTMSSLGSSSEFSVVDAPLPASAAAPVGLLSKDGGKKNIIAGPAIGAYLSKSATERLSTTQTRPVISSFPRHQRPGDTDSQVSSFKHADQGQFVNRLVYEYKDKRERQQKEVEFASKHDINTGELLFQPKVGPDPDEALGFGSTSVRDKSNGVKRNVFEEIMIKDNLLKQKRQEAADKAVAHQMKDLSSKQVKALDTSHQILQQSTENNIEELFQVLLEAQQHIIRDGNAAPLVAGSTEPEWKTFLVDLDVIDTEMMIAEVGLLLNEIRAHKINQLARTKLTNHAENNNNNLTAEEKQEKENEEEEVDESNMLVSFASFRTLVLQCMKRRDGTGRSYVYVPKKKADVTMQMIQNNLKEETFRPTIDKHSATLCLRRHKDLSDYPIEDVLQVEGERIRSKWESARQARILQDSQELTFKPKLFKPPSYIRPKYYGMDETDAAPTSDNEEEEREPHSKQSQHVSDETRITEDDGVDEQHHQHRGRDRENHDDDHHSFASSMVSSEVEPQVVQMPALQPRPQSKHFDFASFGAPPLPVDTQAQSHPIRPPLSPVLRVRELSPSSHHSEDEHSINTISTTFTTEEMLRHHRHHSPGNQNRIHDTNLNSGRGHSANNNNNVKVNGNGKSYGNSNDNGNISSGRSVSSAGPLVTRRNTGSSSFSKTAAPTLSSISAAQNDSSVSHKSTTSVGIKRGGVMVVNRTPKANSTAGRSDNSVVSSAPALPLLPHELMQQKGTPVGGYSSKGAEGGSWKSSRVSDASELTASTEVSRLAGKQR